MFGYVIPDQAALDDAAKARYRTAYCGLCRRIGALHGLRGRLTLSYDLTFLNLLLSSLYEGESACITGSSHCPIHPIRKVSWRHSGPTDYCADLSVALHWSPELRSIGFHLGKFIYLLDAYDDLARDEKKGAYNPLRSLSRQPDYEEEMRDIFELLLARCARSFERLPCVEDADLLRNILYSGVWLKYNCKQAKEAGKK